MFRKICQSVSSQAVELVNKGVAPIAALGAAHGALLGSLAPVTSPSALYTAVGVGVAAGAMIPAAVMALDNFLTRDNFQPSYSVAPVCMGSLDKIAPTGPYGHGPRR